jgi:hypothetical protein
MTARQVRVELKPDVSKFFAATQHWISDPVDGTKAYVSGSDLPRWEGLGWTVTTPPEPGDWVWLRHESAPGAWRCNAAAAPLQEPRGWTPGEPLPPVDLARPDVPNPPAIDGDSEE